MADDISSALIAHLFANGYLDDKLNRLNQPRVGGAAFGMPSVPPLGQDRPPEFSRSPTVREQMQSRPIVSMAPLHAAAEIAGVPWWLRGGEEPDTRQKGMGEFVKEGVPAAVSAMPGGKLYSTVPRTLATSTALSLAPMAPSLFSTAAEAATKKQQAPTAPAGPPPDDGLSDQQRARRDELNAQQKQDGSLPRSLREELKGINDTATEYTKEKNRNRTEAEGIAAKAKAKREAEKVEREAAEAEHERQRAKTFAGQHPWIALGMQTGSAVGGSLLGRYIKGVGARNYNTAINDLNTRWRQATEEGSRALGGTGGRWSAAKNAELSRAEFMAERAQRLQQQIEARRTEGPSKQWAPLALSMAGSEFGSALPTIIDKSTEGINPSLPDTAQRFITGAGFGGASGLIAAKSGLPLANPAGYSAETAALLRAAKALRRRHP